MKLTKDLYKPVVNNICCLIIGKNIPENHLEAIAIISFIKVFLVLLIALQAAGNYFIYILQGGS